MIEEGLDAGFVGMSVQTLPWDNWMETGIEVSLCLPTAILE